MRHAAHGLLPHTLAGRMPGVPLSTAGRDQAAALGKRFTGAPIAVIVSSPVQRAIETAAPIAGRLGRETSIEPGFEEIDFGDWTGLSFDALEADPAWHSWNRLRSLSGCPGGESMQEVQSRALSALRSWRSQHADQSIVVVSHADIIRVLLAPALGLPLDRLYRLTIDPASVSTLVVFDEDMRIDRLNS